MLGCYNGFFIAESVTVLSCVLLQFYFTLNTLEAALHRAFEDRKLNMVNTRREFFYVTLDEIKQVVKENFDKTVEFIDFPDAEQYRTSLKMREQLLA